MNMRRRPRVSMRATDRLGRYRMSDFTDARSLADGTRVETDVCIVGAGAAGITIARELADAGWRVCLVEAGGVKAGGRDQAMAGGDVVGLPYTPLDESRAFGLGGTTATWTGWCRPLDPLDFERRDWVPYSGWPFGYDTLEPYYQRAQPLCELGPYTYDPADWQSPVHPPLRLGGFDSPVFQFSPPTHFGRRYAGELQRSPNIEVLLHAHASRLRLDATGQRVACLELHTLSGRTHTVEARRFVLAAGGIGNPWLLLNSDGEQPEGIGNAHDLVGRYFAEHPYLNASTLVLNNVATPMRFYEGHPAGSPGYNGKVVALLSLSSEVRRAERLVNCVFRFPEAFKSHRAFASRGVASLNHLLKHVVHGALPYRWSRHLGYVVRDAGSVTTVLARKIAMPGHPVAARRPMRVFIESSPNPDSRVTLGDRRDEFGRPAPVLDWRINELDRQSLVAAHRRLDEAMRAADLGRVEMDFDLEFDWVDRLQHGNHHMGTTRMHADPAQGVVDADGRIHGVDNLFVAGSSVFPTAGSANPTLTIVALALRLADHLRGRS